MQDPIIAYPSPQAYYFHEVTLPFVIQYWYWFALAMALPIAVSVLSPLWKSKQKGKN
jgi:hypothetical protein